MTVGTNGPQVLDRIELVRGSGECKRLRVVDVNKALAEVTVQLFKEEITYGATKAIMLETSCPRSWVALISIHPNLFAFALPVRLPWL